MISFLLSWFDLLEDVDVLDLRIFLRDVLAGGPVGGVDVTSVCVLRNL